MVATNFGFLHIQVLSATLDGFIYLQSLMYMKIHDVIVSLALINPLGELILLAFVNEEQCR